MLGSGPVGKGIKQNNYLKVKGKKKKTNIVSSILLLTWDTGFIFLETKNHIPSIPVGNPIQQWYAVLIAMFIFIFF